MREKLDEKQQCILQEIEVVEEKKLETLKSQQSGLIEFRDILKEDLHFWENRSQHSKGEYLHFKKMRQDLEQLKKLSIFPLSNRGFDSILVVNEQLSALDRLKLEPILDVSNCYLENPRYVSSPNVEVKFKLKTVDIQGRLIELSENPFVFQVLKHPQNAKPVIASHLDRDSVCFCFTTDVTGAYLIGIHADNVDVKEVPVLLRIVRGSTDNFELTVDSRFTAAFNPLTSEIWIKPSLSSKSVFVFNGNLEKIKEFKMPFDYTWYTIDLAGNILLAGGREYQLLDKNFNLLWKNSTLVNKLKQVYPACMDHDKIYICGRKRICVLAKKTGEIHAVIKELDIEDPSCCLLHNGDIWLSDLLEVKVLELQNLAIKSRFSCEQGALLAFQNTVFHCPFNSSRWKKLEVF